VDLSVLVHTFPSGAEDLPGLPVVDIQVERAAWAGGSQLPRVLPDFLRVKVVLGNFPQLTHETANLSFIDRTIGTDVDLGTVEVENAPISCLRIHGRGDGWGGEANADGAVEAFCT